MSSTRPSSLARLLLVTLAASRPAAAAGAHGFIHFDGIAGDGGDAEHPGWFRSQSLEVAGLMGSGGVNPKTGGIGSFWLAGGGAGFDALVRACLSHQNFATAEVAFGPDKYVLGSVALEGIQVYGGGATATGAGAGKGPIVVSFRFMSLHDERVPGPGLSTRAGGAVKVGVAPLLLAPTPTAPRSR